MKFRTALACLAVGWMHLAANLPTLEAQYYAAGQIPGPQAGNQNSASAIPTMMASPLAGGPAATAGGQFVDVHGNSIVMPAQYEMPCQEGYPCMPGAGYGDPMTVDFGGYAEDQIGPHYFDVAFDAVFLKPEGLLRPNIPALTSLGVGSAAGQTDFPFLDVSGADESYEPGWRIAARYDLGPLSVIEGTYMGLYDFGFSKSVQSSDVDPGNLPFQLFSIFSQYGFDPAGFIPEFDQADVHRVEYQADLQSTEISYRRYWVGNSTRISGTYLLGARYLRLTEDFRFSAETFNNGGSISFDTENDLVGFQCGGDGWLGLRQGLRVGCEGKAGVYNNRFKFNSATTVTSTPANLQPSESGDQVAFVAEGGATLVADILPSWSIRGGYQVLYVSELVLAGDNISTTQFADVPVDQPALAADGHALYHGFNLGMEYVW